MLKLILLVFVLIRNTSPVFLVSLYGALFIFSIWFSFGLCVAEMSFFYSFIFLDVATRIWYNTYVIVLHFCQTTLL